jgi:hypothetical protein
MVIPRQARRVYFPAFRTTAWEEVELPEPAALGPQEVLVRVRCSVVSAGTELAVFGGTHTINPRTVGGLGCWTPNVCSWSPSPAAEAPRP